ncbi:hypothetical protein LWI29_007781 [Acer saccharum]|uniref:AAA ATPase AAA+ lid domain-containing protein n=1 Tax=Acer saccharum TaxID=4024 RepID=A0AA39RIG9_ACESA|nr:hypothetical protein LWI29_007781 [Acer saccharum]
MHHLCSFNYIGLVDAIDPALRRSGRFDAEIEVTVPTEEERFEILKLYAKKIPLEANVDLQAIAASCNGYVGADLEALCREATMSAVKRSSDADECASVFCVTMEDWKHARSVAGPSITRGVTVEIPKVSWEDIGGLRDLKGILVLAATNRPHAIDAALLRPGRFDLVLYVPSPDLEARYEILCVHTINMKVGDDVDLRGIAEDTELFTGAELEGLCRKAGIVALRENISATVVCNHHFQTVKDALKPALTKEEVNSYSSYMKTRSLTTSGQSESNAIANRDTKSKKNLLVPVLSVTTCVVSVAFLAAAKYFSMHTNQTRHELATT